LISLEFVSDRTKATLSAQDSVKESWVWEEKTVEDWKKLSADFDTQSEAAQKSETFMLKCRGLLDASLADLHARTVQGVKMARVRYRSDPAQLAIVNRLSADGQDRDTILDQAQAWASAWAELDSSWAPVPTNTLDAFNELRAKALEQEQDYIDAHTAWRAAAERLNQQAVVLNDLTVAWYAAATAVFAEGTAEGDMIRSTVPTTYAPASVPPAGKPPESDSPPA
jgi:hypothetical protein